MMNKKVFVAMSGGVDSSVTAFLLKKQGYNVMGVFMRCYNLDGCAERDAEDARRVAEHIGIPFYIFDFEKEYKKKVVKYMIDGYKKGITPNPDVMCNKEIKFGLFLDKALELGADYVATGHYVRLFERKNILSSTRSSRPATGLTCSPAALRRHPAYAEYITADHAEPPAQVSEKNIFSLTVAKDNNKDQSYFLWMLTQEQLRHCLFPLGDCLKSEVREIARKAGLPTAEKKDSQGICFLGKVGVKDFLKSYIKPKKGDVLDTRGRKIGEHEGAQFYTIGQRHIGMTNRGLTLVERGKTRKKDFEPCYVADKNIKTNTIVMAEGDGNPALYKKEIFVTDINFINPMIHNSKFIIPIMVRVRYRQPLAKAILRKLQATGYELTFNTSQKFIASGQSAVFYSKKNELIGGGVIC